MDTPKFGSVFWSYSRTADDYDKNEITSLRNRLHKAIEVLHGSRINLMIDSLNVRHGQNLETRIHHLISTSCCMVPILSPTYFQSDWCHKEYLWFREQERLIGRSDLILPILYIDVNNTEGFCGDDVKTWKEDLLSRLYLDWHQMRGRTNTGIDGRDKLETFAKSIWHLVSTVKVPEVPEPNYHDSYSTLRIPKVDDPQYERIILELWSDMTGTQRQIIKLINSQAEGDEISVDDLLERINLSIGMINQGPVTEMIADELYYRAKTLMYQGFLRMRVMGERITLISLVPRVEHVLKLKGKLS